MKSQFYYLCGLFGLLFIFSSCDNKDVAPDSVLTAEINGVSFSAKSRQIKATVVWVDLDDEPNSQVIITAGNADGHKLRLLFKGVDEGNYTIQQNEAEASYKPYRKAEYDADKGSINITRYSGERIAGSFYFEAENYKGNEIEVIEGEFNIYLE